MLVKLLRYEMSDSHGREKTTHSRSKTSAQYAFKCYLKKTFSRSKNQEEDPQNCQRNPKKLDNDVLKDLKTSLERTLATMQFQEVK